LASSAHLKERWARLDNRGVTDANERRSAGRATGLLWLVGGISGALFYLVPGADLAHWRLGLVSCTFSVVLGIACLIAPWARMSAAWIYAAAGVSLLVIPFAIAVNGGADSPTVLYLFLATVLFGYYLPTRLALVFLAVGVLVPATPMLYDPQALEATFIARYVLTAPIYAAVGLTVVLAKRQLVAWRNEARELSLHDPLTGLANRRALTDAMRTMPRPIALVMIDLDNFKLANTLYGHVGGDRVLCRVAAVLRRVTRHDDLVARLGGDEFALLVPGASEARLKQLSDRVVSAIRDADTGLTPPGYRLTASAGYALVEGGGDVDSLLETADRRLRRAKGEGKDRWDAGSEVGVHVHAT
jgi:diguanylate cyclase (GGDEF)-like protein